MVSPRVPYGAWPILVTPFTNGGTLDFPALDELIEFYVDASVPGLFALGQASEVLTLTDDERFALAERIAARCRGRLPVVAVGNFGASLDEQARSLERVAAAGIDVALVALSILPSAHGLGEQLLELAQLTDAAVPLGIYELPDPEHRLLTPDEVSLVARSERFVFMKDTVRQIEPFTAKVAAAQGTPLKIFQANLKITPPSLAAGCHGFCGWMPIVAPELSRQLCDVDGTSEELREQAHTRLLEFQAVLVENVFPASAKHVLARRGLTLTSRCRVRPPEQFGQAQMDALDAYIEMQQLFAPIRAG